MKGRNTGSFLDQILHESGLCQTEPPIDRELVGDTLRERYGLDGELERIATEKDDTFRLRVRCGPTVSSGQNGHHGRDFLVKCSPSSEPVDVVALQTEAMVHLEHHRPDLPAQRVIPTLDAHRAVELDLGGPHPRVLRVLTFLPGLLLNRAARTPDQWHLAGQILGRLTEAMGAFTHPRQNRLLLWDMAHFHRLGDLLGYVTEPDCRQLAQEIFAAYGKVVVPTLPRLERQVIHGDFSPFNAVADPEAPDFVTGIIDFGDTVNTCVLFDPAVAMANLIGTDASAPWETAMAFLRGYQRTRPLRAEEVVLLREVALGRLLLRAMVVCWRAATDSERHAYLLSHAKRDWYCLRAAWSTPPEQVQSALAATAATTHTETTAPSSGLERNR